MEARYGDTAPLLSWWEIALGKVDSSSLKSPAPVGLQKEPDGLPRAPGKH